VNWSVIVAIARRDLLAVRRNRGVFAPLIIVPVVLVTVFPVLAFLVSRAGEELRAFEWLLGLLPREVVTGLPPQPGAQLGLLLAAYIIPPVLLLIPVMVASVLATDSIAGERERDTLEGLLLAPATEREIIFGKLVGALAPALAVGLVCALVYAVAVDVLFWSIAGGPVLPSVTWLATVVWLGPAITSAALGLTLVISARAQSVQSASQLSGVAVLPLVLLTIGQLSGAVLIVWWVTLPLGAVLWLAAAVLLRLGARRLSSERVISRS